MSPLDVNSYQQTIQTAKEATIALGKVEQAQRLSPDIFRQQIESIYDNNCEKCISEYERKGLVLGLTGDVVRQQAQKIIGKGEQKIKEILADEKRNISLETKRVHDEDVVALIANLKNIIAEKVSEKGMIDQLQQGGLTDGNGVLQEKTKSLRLDQIFDQAGITAERVWIKVGPRNYMNRGISPQSGFVEVARDGRFIIGNKVQYAFGGMTQRFKVYPGDTIRMTKPIEVESQPPAAVTTLPTPSRPVLSPSSQGEQQAAAVPKAGEEHAVDALHLRKWENADMENFRKWIANLSSTEASLQHFINQTKLIWNPAEKPDLYAQQQCADTVIAFLAVYCFQNKIDLAIPTYGGVLRLSQFKTVEDFERGVYGKFSASNIWGGGGLFQPITRAEAGAGDVVSIKHKTGGYHAAFLSKPVDADTFVMLSGNQYNKDLLNPETKAEAEQTLMESGFDRNFFRRDQNRARYGGFGAKPTLLERSLAEKQSIGDKVVFRRINYQAINRFLA